MAAPRARLRNPEDRMGPEGRYILQRRIGEGAQGSVWLAHDSQGNVPVAVKFLLAEASRNPITRARFAREGHKFGKLRHPNLVRMLQVGESAEEFYLVSEYVPGQNLHEILGSRGALDVLDALDICRDIASGLAEAHDQHVVHRDLKPSNIMIRHTDSCVKVLDFGIAKDLASNTVITIKGTFVGTPAYSAPEQIQGDPVDGRADIYALGVIFFELLAGLIDFQGRHSTEVMRATLRQERIPLNHLFNLVTRPVARIIQRMTRKLPDRRPGSMQQVMDECVRLRTIVEQQCSADDRLTFRSEIKTMFEG